MSTRRILPPPAPPGPGKHIAFDRATGDYAAYYDGQLLGYRPTHPEAQALADQYVYDLFTHGQPVRAGELAAGGMICIRCHTPTATEDMSPGRRHCRACQRRAGRLSYYRHRFAKLEQVSRRRAESYGCPIADGIDYALIYAEQIGLPCALCGECVQPENYEFDHVWPLADGGAHSQQNIRLVHRQCNRAASMRRFILARVLNRAL